MQRYIVTGGAGFIGTNLIMRLMRDHEVLMLDHNPKKSVLYNNGSGVKVSNVDVVDNDDLLYVIQDFDPHCIFHLAGFVKVRESIQNPSLCNKVNVEGTLNVLEACRELGCKMVFTSSCAVYGNPKDLPNREDHPLRPVSPYGISKLTAESYVSFYARTHGLNLISLRLSNVYGTWNHKGAIHIFTEALLKNKPINIFGNGEQRRDFIFVDDVIDAIITASESKHPGEVFNIATGKSTSVNETVKIIRDAIEVVTGKDIKPSISYVDAIRGEIKNSYASIQKASESLAWRPKTEFADGILKTVKWMDDRLGH